nr:MAG TPA: hypothetical protein [Bacteriophage sp.]
MRLGVNDWLFYMANNVNDIKKKLIPPINSLC